MLKNKNLAIIGLIAIVNALGYGIIIPVLYSYSQKFGLTDFQNGLLFAIFSLCQFISTPVIGRLSDLHGRRPVLIVSLLGTAISFFLMAFAPNAMFLFIARALDGITAGNVPVALAVISDTTTEKERAKGFGLIGASFGFGFVFGPAISALTVGYSEQLPFIIAGVISMIAVVITALALPETNKHIGHVINKGPLFNIKKLITAVTVKNVGTTLLITLLYSITFAMFIYAFQPYAVKGLHLSPNQISFIFVIFGVVGLVSQVFILPRLIKAVEIKKLFIISLIGAAIVFTSMFFASNMFLFLICSVLLSLVTAPINPLIQTILSKEVDVHEQGEMQGLNASYQSIGQIVGPIIAGAITTYVIQIPFLVGGLVTLICVYLATKVDLSHHKEQTDN